MVSKCANPACRATFLNLRSGKVYVIRRHATSYTGMRSARLDFSEVLDQVHYAWLCASCCRTMTIQTNSGGEILVVPSVPT